MRTPRRRASSSASVSAGVVTPGASAAETIARAPAATKAWIAAPSAPAYDTRDVDARQVGAPADIELRVGRVASHRPPVDGDATVGIRVAQHPEVGAPEGLESQRGGLGDVARGLDLVVEEHQHAEPARLRRGGDAHGVQEVQRGIGAEAGGGRCAPTTTTVASTLSVRFRK
jgi:hypothetical protein